MINYTFCFSCKFSGRLKPVCICFCHRFINYVYPNSEIINSGTIQPGTSPDILNITGDLILDSNSILEIELAGTGGVPGTDFDRIAVSGNVNLDGTINITEFGGFTANVGNTFDVITFATNSGPGIQLITAPLGDIYVDSLFGLALRLTMTVNGGFAIFWDGGGDGFSWDDPDNWSLDALPLITENILIDPAGAITVVVDSAGMVALQLTMPPYL